MPTYGPLSLNKHRNLGELTFEQVDGNWDQVESVVNKIGRDLAFQFPIDNLTATTDPTANDDSSKGYSEFSRWYNSTNQTLWVLTDPTPGAAVWVDTGWEYFELGSASVANIGTGATEVPTNDMLGTSSVKNTLSGTGDIPLTDSTVVWTSSHTFQITNTSLIATEVPGFVKFMQAGTGESGITFQADTVSANFGISAAGELLFGGGTLGAFSYAVYHAGVAAEVDELIEGDEAKPVTADTIYPANACVVSSGSGAFAPDFKEGRSFSRTLTGNSTLANPTNVENGMSGIIVLNIDGTGGYTFSIAGSNYKNVGGSPTITNTANAKNIFTYFVESSSSILLSYAGVAT